MLIKLILIFNNCLITNRGKVHARESRSIYLKKKRAQTATKA